MHWKNNPCKSGFTRIHTSEFATLIFRFLTPSISGAKGAIYLEKKHGFSALNTHLEYRELKMREHRCGYAFW